MKISRRKARSLAKKIRKQLDRASGKRRSLDRKTIDRACQEAGITSTEEIAVAWILFGPPSLPGEFASLLDEKTMDMLECLNGASDMVADSLWSDDIF
jgi:hypothetical protein